MRLRKRLFKALKEGWRQGYSPRQATEVEARTLEDRVVLPAQTQVESVDSALRAGKVDTEKWGLEDGKAQGG